MKKFFSEKKNIVTAIVCAVILALCVTETVMLRRYFKQDEIPVIGGETDTRSDKRDDSGNASDTETEDAPDSDTSGTSSANTGASTASNAFENTPTLAETSASTASSAESTVKVSAGSAAITASFSSGNTWPDGGKTVTQYSGVIENTGSAACSSWTVTVDVPSDTELIGSWNGIYTLNGGKLTIKNEVYNGEIAAGSSTDIGFQLKSSNSINLGTGTGSGTAAATTNPTNPSEPSAPPPPYTPSSVKGKQGDDWLSVSGNKIVDKDGKEVWLTGVNWFGYNTGTNTFDGLWSANLESSLQSIADHGFNLLRIPMSVELVKNWQNGIYPKANYNTATNANLNSMNSLQIFDYALDICENVGIKVMIDMHSAKTDSMGHMYAVWYNGNITTEDFYSSLEWLAARYKDNDTVIAYDLKNEPHGKPDENPRAVWNNSASDDNWKYVAETAALKVLAKNPNVLIMVEGTEIYPTNIKNNNFTSKNSADYHYNWWGGNLRGVKDYPINLGKFQNKLVYSPHDYGPAVYEQPWFKNGYTYDSLMKDCWKDNWFYIYENKTAPLLIGEWGGYMTQPNLTWMTHLRTLIKTYKLHHTFWCFNSNSGDTGGLVKDDFTTWDTEKYNFVKDVLWQKNGKFVGLDHEVPLGNNGIALKNY